ncbi:hypothetical protein PRIC2_002348 [Phytophthora ramorum]
MANYTPSGPASSSPLKSVGSPPLSAPRSLSARGLPTDKRSSGLSETSAPVGDAVSSTRKTSTTTAVAAAPARPGTYSFVVAGTNFQIDEKYKFIKVIGRGAYGVVISAENTETNEKVAVKKISRAFEDLVDAKRILREIKLLQHFDHENVITIVDLLPPPSLAQFEDVYIIADLMETDLHRIIYSRQPLTDDHIICDKIGTPCEEDLHFVVSERAKRFMKNQPVRPGVPFAKLFPKASPEAVDLLQRMLVFDPAKRISVEEALEHPYLASLHNMEDEPVADSFFSFDFEKEDLTEARLKELIFEEILKIHPDATRSPIKSPTTGLSSPPAEQVLSPSTTRSHAQE